MSEIEEISTPRARRLSQTEPPPDFSSPAAFGPGLTSPTTLIFTMHDDNEDQNISIPNVEGKYSMFFWDTNCAYTGGCTP